LKLWVHLGYAGGMAEGNVTTESVIGKDLHQTIQPSDVNPLSKDVQQGEDISEKGKSRRRFFAGLGGAILGVLGFAAHTSAQRTEQEIQDFSANLDANKGPKVIDTTMGYQGKEHLVADSFSNPARQWQPGDPPQGYLERAKAAEAKTSK